MVFRRRTTSGSTRARAPDHPNSSCSPARGCRIAPVRFAGRGRSPVSTTTQPDERSRESMRRNTGRIPGNYRKTAACYCHGPGPRQRHHHRYGHRPRRPFGHAVLHGNRLQPSTRGTRGAARSENRQGLVYHDLFLTEWVANARLGRADTTRLFISEPLSTALPVEIEGYWLSAWSHDGRVGRTVLVDWFEIAGVGCGDRPRRRHGVASNKTTRRSLHE